MPVRYLFITQSLGCFEGQHRAYGANSFLRSCDRLVQHGTSFFPSTYFAEGLTQGIPVTTDHLGLNLGCQWFEECDRPLVSMRLEYSFRLGQLSSSVLSSQMSLAPGASSINELSRIQRDHASSGWDIRDHIAAVPVWLHLILLHLIQGELSRLMLLGCRCLGMIV